MTTLDHYDRAMHQCASDHARWCALNRAAAELREGARVFEPYSFVNRPLVKATYESLADGLITHSDFAAVLSNVRGEWL